MFDGKIKLSDDYKYKLKCKLKTILIEKINNYETNKIKGKIGRPNSLSINTVIDAIFLRFN